mgnify:CR=1 FL=1
MGASSVTGVGPGSVEGKNQGSKHWTVGVGRLIGPKVMAADSQLLDGSGDATVVLPKLSGVVGDYIVMATDSDTSGATAVTASLAFNDNDTTITLKGTADNTVVWSIIKKGLTT